MESTDTCWIESANYSVWALSETDFAVVAMAAFDRSHSAETMVSKAHSTSSLARGLSHVLLDSLPQLPDDLDALKAWFCCPVNVPEVAQQPLPQNIMLMDPYHFVLYGC